MTAAEYLASRSIRFRVSGSELQFQCPFSSDCTTKHHAGHCYINAETGTYYCQKCGAKGNLVTLARHFGDDPREFGFIDNPEPVRQIIKRRVKQIERKLTAEQVDQWHAALPEDIRKFLKEERGLSDRIIAEAKLGWDGDRIVIPVSDGRGGWLFAKRRAAPGSNVKPRYLYTKGARVALYGIELLQGTQFVVICEGEFDALVLRSNGIPSVTSTGGAKTFPIEWARQFREIPEIYIVFDRDDAGRAGSFSVGKLISHAKICELPAEVGDVGDITDYFVRLRRTPDEFHELLKNGRTLEEVEGQDIRFKKTPKPDKPMNFEGWRQVIAERFPQFVAAAEVCISVLAQLLIRDIRNPFGLVLVDVPSAGKTITLNFFAEIDELAYASDSFTPSSLVSHASNVRKDQLEEIDLLPRIRFKLFVVRDLAPIFAERPEVLVKSLGILTRVFDGEGLETDSGVHGKRGYRGNFLFMFLAGSTPIPPRVFRTMGNLGSRLFFLDIHSGEKDEEELATQLEQPSFKSKEAECRSATREFAFSLWHQHPHGVSWRNGDDPMEYRRIIARCAKIAARLRGAVNVWTDGENEQQHTNVVIEKPDRLNAWLYNLARGHALVCGRNQIAPEDLWPVIEVALQSAPMNRVKLLGALIESGGTISTDVACRAIVCTTPTALKEIETLKILGLVDTQDDKLDGSPGRPMRIVTLRKEFGWFCLEECNGLRAHRPV